MNTIVPNNGLWIRENGRIRLIPFSDITHIHHQDGLSELRCGKELIKKLVMPLCGIEKMIPGNHFIRTHRNYIVNTNYIKKYDPSRTVIYCNSGEELPVSRRRKKEFETFLYRHYESLKPTCNGRPKHTKRETE